MTLGETARAWPTLRRQGVVGFVPAVRCDGRRWLLLTAMLPLAGCSADSAPALILFGAYFPDWLVFAVLAAAAAIVTRILFGIAGRADALPYPLFTCLAVGVLVAGTIDLLWLDR